MLDAAAEHSAPFTRESQIVHSPPSAPAVDLPAVVDASSGYRFAAVLAYVLNPLVLPPLLIALVVAYFGAALPEVAWVTGVSLVFFVLVPLGYVTWLLRQGRIASIMIRNRSRRTGPLLVGMGSSLMGLVVLYATLRTASSLVAWLLLIYTLNSGLILLVTLRWKISIHLSAMAGFFSALLFIEHATWLGQAATSGVLPPALLYALTLLLPLLAWSRVRVGAHTWAQVTAGALLGLVLPYAELVALFHLGAFGRL